MSLVQDRKIDTKDTGTSSIEGEKKKIAELYKMLPKMLVMKRFVKK
jgi:hypothetical protein